MNPYGNSLKMGLRDVAAFCEDFRGKLTGPTRTVDLVDWRDRNGNPYFADLIRRLVMG